MSSNPCKKWVTEANGRWRGRDVVYRPRYRVLLAARLECILAAGLIDYGNGDERPLPRDVGRERPTSHGMICLFFICYICNSKMEGDIAFNFTWQE